MKVPEQRPTMDEVVAELEATRDPTQATAVVPRVARARRSRKIPRPPIFAVAGLLLIAGTVAGALLVTDTVGVPGTKPSSPQPVVLTAPAWRPVRRRPDGARERSAQRDRRRRCHGAWRTSRYGFGAGRSASRASGSSSPPATRGSSVPSRSPPTRPASRPRSRSAGSASPSCVLGRTTRPEIDPAGVPPEWVVRLANLGLNDQAWINEVSAAGAWRAGAGGTPPGQSRRPRRGSPSVLAADPWARKFDHANDPGRRSVLRWWVDNRRGERKVGDRPLRRSRRLRLREQDPERTRLLLDRHEAMAEEAAAGRRHARSSPAMLLMAAACAGRARGPRRARAARCPGDATQARRALRRCRSCGSASTPATSSSTRRRTARSSSATPSTSARDSEQHAAGRDFVGERDQAAARGAFEFGEPQTVDAKGKSEPVACRTPPRSVAATRPRGGRFERPSVGRTRELGTLIDLYGRAVAASEPHLALVMGDAGVGKSRLLRELWDALSAQREGPVLRIGRLSYGSGINLLARARDPSGAAGPARRRRRRDRYGSTR